MGKVFNGQSYNEDWVPVDAMGNALGPKDYAANAAYAAANQTQNPYTNEAGASPYDKSGLIPGNQPGSTLPAVSGTASQTPAYVNGKQWASIGDLVNLGPTRRSAAPASSAPASGGDVNGIEPWLMSQGSSSGATAQSPSSGSVARPQDDDFISAAVNMPTDIGPQRRSLVESQIDGGEGGQPSGDASQLELLLKLLESGALTGSM